MNCQKACLRETGVPSCEVPESVRLRSRHRKADGPGRPAAGFSLVLAVATRKLCLSGVAALPISPSWRPPRGIPNVTCCTTSSRPSAWSTSSPPQRTDRAIGIVLDRVQTVTNADGAAVEVAEGNVMVHRAVNGLRTEPEGSRTSADTSLSGLCVRVGMPLLCRDTDTDPRVDAAACRRAGVRSIAVAPMVRAGEALGVLRVMSSEAEHFDDADARRPRADGQSPGVGAVQHARSSNGKPSAPCATR